MKKKIRNYKDLYPSLQCDFCVVKSDEVIVYHQRTQYQHVEDNYVAACPDCKKRNDDYWDEMWADYYRNCM